MQIQKTVVIGLFLFVSGFAQASESFIIKPRTSEEKEVRPREIKRHRFLVARKIIKAVGSRKRSDENFSEETSVVTLKNTLQKIADEKKLFISGVRIDSTTDLFYNLWVCPEDLNTASNPPIGDIFQLLRAQKFQVGETINKMQ